jgi:integrase
VSRRRRIPEGINLRHSRSCRSADGGRCSCEPTYQAAVYSARDGRRIWRSFPTLAAAKTWRQDTAVALRRGRLRAPAATTVREAAEAWMAGAESGAVRTRSGDRFKPSTLRGYRAALDRHVLPELGGARLSDLALRDAQDFADRLLGQGLDPSTIRNALMPLRVVCRRAVRDGVLAVNPTAGVELPAVRGRRDRIADPAEAERLIAALPEGDRALWATALYAGLRRGELLALRWEDVDLAGGLLRVERSYDPKAAQFVTAKSRAGRRRVPIAGVLRDHLLDHKLATDREAGLVFGDGRSPFVYSTVRDRAARAWKAAGLVPITLHECRHTFASLMIAAGVNAKALSTYIGHATVAITLDRYGHLMPGAEDEAAELLDAYLARGAEVRHSRATVDPPAERMPADVSG